MLYNVDMTPLTLRLLGSFQASVGTTPIEDFPTDKVRALLAYLAVEFAHEHPRTHLATLLWGDWDEKSAKANLRKSLFRLRKALGSSAENCLTITRTSVQFHAESAEIDLYKFTQLSQSDDLADLSRAVDLYGGDLLAGLEIWDAPTFNEWLTVQREQLHQQFLQLLYQVGELHLAQEDYVAAQAVVTRQLALEAWREGAHRQLMRVYLGLGQRAEALAQYERCVAALEQELGAATSAETEELASAIRGEQLLTTHLHHFAAPQTPFVGRIADLNRLIARLNTPNTRLITLIGTGGIGKTRLAIEAITRSLGNRPAYFLPLHAVTTQEGIWQLLGEQLGIKANRHSKITDEVLAFLRDRAPLLVFDNYEQLLPNTRCIEQLLTHAPDVQILVTSRAPLHLRAEWRLPLEGLEVPPSDGADIADFPAVQLLLTTGQQVRPTLELSAENAPHINRICRYLAGMPLALEMAGSWLALYTPELLADQIEQNLDLLVATRGDMPERHRSLRAIFDYALAQLGSAERTLLTQLTVFQGTFSLTAVLTILRASPLALNTLIDHALLQRQGNDRFGLHPVLRAFLEGAIPTAIEQNHARYYLQHIAATDPANIAETVNDISLNLANVRAAWTWAITQGEEMLLDTALDGLLAYYEYRGSYIEGREQFMATDGLRSAELVNRMRLAEATCLQKLGDSDGAIALVNAVARAEDAPLEALIRLAELYERRTEHDLAIATAQRALKVAEPFSADAARIWRILGFVYLYRGAMEERLEALRQALAINEVLGDALGSAECHNMIGLIHKDKGEYADGIIHLQRAIEIAKALNHREGVAQYTNNLGGLYMNQSALELAEQCFQQSLALAQQLNHKQGITICTGNLGIVAKQRRDYAGALRYYRTAVQMAEQVGDKASQAVFLGNVGNALMDMGQYAEAITHFEQAAEIDRAANALKGVGRHLASIGDAFRFQRQYARAIPYFEEAITYLRQSDNAYFLCWVLVTYAESLFEVGRFAEAQQANAEGGAMATAQARDLYRLFSTLLDARLKARTEPKTPLVAALRTLREQEQDPEQCGEIDYAIWQITGDSADFATAQASLQQLYATTKRAHYRNRLGGE